MLTKVIPSKARDLLLVRQGTASQFAKKVRLIRGSELQLRHKARRMSALQRLRKRLIPFFRSLFSRAVMAAKHKALAAGGAAYSRGQASPLRGYLPRKITSPCPTIWSFSQIRYLYA